MGKYLDIIFSKILNTLRKAIRRKTGATNNPCAEIQFGGKYNSEIMPGDTVGIGGISGIYFGKDNLGLRAIRPVMAKFPIAIPEDAGRGWEFWRSEQTKLLHLEIYEQESLIRGKRVVLVEKSTKHLLRADEKVPNLRIALIRTL